MIGLGNQGGGKDDVSGYNTHAFVLQVPASRRHPRRPAGQAARTPPTPSSASGRPPSARSLKVNGSGKPIERWKQVSRLGNPLINEVIIPIGEKDKYNAHVARRRREELRRSAR